jgi:NifU-like protein involved in Fe-S cluster formation
MLSAEPYSARVAALFRAAPGAGRPEGPGWVSGEACEPLAATHVRWHLRSDGGRVAETRFEVRGCPHTIATAAAVAAALPGRPLAGLSVDIAGVAAELGVPREKLGRLFVIQDAILNAALLLQAPRP